MFLKFSNPTYTFLACTYILSQTVQIPLRWNLQNKNIYHTFLNLKNDNTSIVILYHLAISSEKENAIKQKKTKIINKLFCMNCQFYFIIEIFE